MTLKVCCECKEEKNLSEFRKDALRVDGRQSWCRLCARAKCIQYSATYLASRENRCQTRAKRATAMMHEAKASGCILCSEKEVLCLDLHHKDPSKKDFAISAYRNASVEKIKNEIAKCVVLCANCHRKVHAGIVQL